MAIQNRRGLRKDFDPQKMLPGEFAVAIDEETKNQIVWMCFAPGVVKRMATLDDLQEEIGMFATFEIDEQGRFCVTTTDGNNATFNTDENGRLVVEYA